MKGTYWRWSRIRAYLDRHDVRTLGDESDARYISGLSHPEYLSADILGSETSIEAHPASGTVRVTVPNRPLDPDETRMIGVRMIEAAVLADNGRSVREP